MAKMEVEAQLSGATGFLYKFGRCAPGDYRPLNFDLLSYEIQSSDRLLTCIIRRLHERVSQIFYVLVYRESRYRIVQRRLETRWSSLTMDTAGKQLVLGKPVHRPVVITIKL